MYYDMDYYGVLMSKIGGGSGWNNYGYGSSFGLSSYLNNWFA